MVGDNKRVINPQVPQRIKYHSADKKNIFKDIEKAIPKELNPTKKTGYVFGAIFLIVIIYAIFTFPFSKLMSPNVEALEIKVGLPWSFLVFDMYEPEKSPIRLGNLVIDMLIYLALSYAIDIALNLFLNAPLLESPEEKKKRPHIFKDIRNNPPPTQIKIQPPRKAL